MSHGAENANNIYKFEHMCSIETFREVQDRLFQSKIGQECTAHSECLDNADDKESKLVRELVKKYLELNKCNKVKLWDNGNMGEFDKFEAKFVKTEDNTRCVFELPSEKGQDNKYLVALHFL